MKWQFRITTKQIVRRMASAHRVCAQPGLGLEALEDRCLPATGVQEFLLPQPPPFHGAFPVSLTYGPDGNIWFADAGAQAVGKITPIGVVTEYSALIATENLPGTARTITTGPDGNLWFTEYRSNF